MSIKSVFLKALCQILGMVAQRVVRPPTAKPTLRAVPMVQKAVAVGEEYKPLVNPSKVFTVHCKMMRGRGEELFRR